MAENKTILRISGLTKKYGDVTALEGIDLDIREGEVTVILGPSGCGKSTLLRCMNGLETIAQGQIEFDGRVITAEGTKWPEIRQKIGMVFQSYELFPHMTILENILLGPLKVQKRERAEAQQQAETPRPGGPAPPQGLLSTGALGRAEAAGCDCARPLYAASADAV